ncbi:alpha/beta hydrolase [Lentzea kentuckyensis]|uniref:alpha/beta hydrolase n=1 Tax=Lentzea kentuckyensis TaxID=360086 RepID=UPI001FE5B94E|nr:alpha/beta hydrolase [Lentzea kentuckyensis]
MRRVLASSLAAMVLVVCAGAANAEPPKAIAWAPCPDNPQGECGALSVPLDWAKPWGRRIDVAVARHKATDPARRIGVLMVDPGGPGGSAAAFALSRLFSPELRARFDIVGIDSRGTGNTLPIRCADLMTDAPSSYPADEAGFDALLQYNKNVLGKCRARSGPIFDHADSATVAQDMDATRRALGERKISYLGLSYGTVFGQAYAEKFGHRVRAMALDSVVDHSADLRRFMGDRAAAVDDSFAEFARWCDRTVSCALHGQNVYTAWEAALVRADGEPFGRQRLIDSLYFALGAPDWAWGADLIAGTETQRRASLVFEPNYESVRLATVCQDFSLRIRNFEQYSRLRAEELRRSPIMRGSLIGHDEATTCAGVPGPPSNPPHRLDIGHAPKILVLSARHDPNTPYAWAANIHRQAPRNTALLTYEGWGHVAYPRSDCTRGGVDAYLLDLTIPAVSCPAVEPQR